MCLGLLCLWVASREFSLCTGSKCLPRLVQCGVENGEGSWPKWKLAWHGLGSRLSLRGFGAFQFWLSYVMLCEALQGFWDTGLLDPALRMALWRVDGALDQVHEMCMCWRSEQAMWLPEFSPCGSRQFLWWVSLAMLCSLLAVVRQHFAELDRIFGSRFSLDFAGLADGTCLTGMMNHMAEEMNVINSSQRVGSALSFFSMRCLSFCSVSLLFHS